MKTILNDEMRRKAIDRIVLAMSGDPSANDHWNSGRNMCECFGWTGSGMSPITRVAFVSDYGEEVTADLEKAAKAEIESIQAFGAKYRQHCAEAAETAKKPVGEWLVDDFIMALDCGLKFDHQNIHHHLWDFVEGEDMDAGRIENSMWDHPEYRHVRPRLCKITRIIEKPEGFFNDANALRGYEPMGHEGGSASEDVPEDMSDVDIANLPEVRRDAVYATFYTLCVLVRAGDEWVLIDAEGGSYARYVLVPQDYRTMFAPIIEDIRAKKEIERKEAEAKAAAKEAEARAKYDARCAKWAPIMKPLIVFAADDCNKDWRANENIAKGNVLAMARHAFPGVYFTLRKRYDWGRGWLLSWTNGPTEDEMKAATDFGLFCEDWDTFDGMTDCAGVASAKFIDFAKKYGSVTNGIDFNRTEAATDRNRKPEALPAAPAVTLIDGGVSVTENTEKNGIEIRFARKPSNDTLERIKSRRCWRWSRFSKCWYTRANETEREFARALASELN